MDVRAVGSTDIVGMDFNPSHCTNGPTFIDRFQSIHHVIQTGPTSHRMDFIRTLFHNLLIRRTDPFNKRRAESLVFHFVQADDGATLRRCDLIDLFFRMAV